MSTPVPGDRIEITQEARLRLSVHLEEVLGPSRTGTLFRSLSPRGTVKPLDDPAIVDLFDGLEELLGPEDAATLIAMLPMQPFTSRHTPRVA